MIIVFVSDLVKVNSSAAPVPGRYPRARTPRPSDVLSPRQSPRRRGAPGPGQEPRAGRRGPPPAKTGRYHGAAAAGGPRDRPSPTRDRRPSAHYAISGLGSLVLFIANVLHLPTPFDTGAKHTHR